MADEKKLIIDEDWKSQVQAEKDEAARKSAESEPASSSDQPAAEELADVPMPPASFELLATTLATEALVALGQVPHPATGQPHFHPQQAKYLIDTIDVLKQKTKGNLTPDEDRMLDGLLHQLRMVFIETGAAQSQGTGNSRG
jgi:hypothetical protein